MNMKKIKVLASIFNGKINVEKTFQKYKELESKLMNNFNFEINAELIKEKESFQISLCNYYESLINESKLFDKINLVKDYIYKPVELKTLRNIEKTYSLDSLFRAFRNKKEHPEKIDCVKRYNLFKSSVDMDMCIELYKYCDIVLEYEIEKLTVDELVKLFEFNPDIKALRESKLLGFTNLNKKIKNENPKLYKLNLALLNKIDSSDLDEMTFETVEKNCESFDEYFKSSEYKNAFIKRYGIKKYERLLEIINDDELSINEYIITFQEYISDLINIEIEKNE